ncbi:MAG: hypothetical protein JWS12_611 [Candidatus Saccharibacteria bacterium]|nr:hypothetical protein [Candidatus Saccharibacteria bacterium]
MTYQSGMHQATAGFMPTPTLIMPYQMWQKIMAYVQACPVEINGFGMIDRLGNQLQLSNIFILEQTAEPAAVEIDPIALGRFITDMVLQGEDTARMRFQWHSHVRMPAFFSGTDMANIEAYTADWMVSMVTNKLGEYELRLDVFRPFRTWTPLELKVVSVVDERLAAECRIEVAAKVRQPRRFMRQNHVKPTNDNVHAALRGEEILPWEAD